MDRWAPVNERQLSVLRRVAEGDDLGSDGRINDRRSARALADRHLVTISRRRGRWSASITEAGCYYLEHGSYPSEPSAATRSRASTHTARPATASTDGSEIPPRPATSAALDPVELLAQIAQAPDRIVRIAAVDARTRAAYRRAIHAARQKKLVSDGFDLLFTGRSSGDIVLHLAAEADGERKAWASARYRARNEISDPDEIIAALDRGGWLYMVAEDLRPVALDLCRALLAAAADGGHEMVAVTSGTRIRLSLLVGSRRHDVFITQEHDQVRHEASPTERRNASRNPWKFKIPEFDKVPAQRLELFMNHGYNERVRWEGILPTTIRRRVREILEDLVEQERARRESHEAWQREYQAQQEEWRQQKEEERRQWAEAMDRAQTMAVERIRADVFHGAFDGWLRAQQIREFCSALQASHADDSEESGLNQWVAWVRSVADEIDPTVGSKTLANVPFEVTPEPDELQPFLGKWSPLRPEIEYRSEPATRNSSDDIALRRQWHPGLKGRQSWWRH